MRKFWLEAVVLAALCAPPIGPKLASALTQAVSAKVESWSADFFSRW